VTKILEEQFPETEKMGKTKDPDVSKISHLKYVLLVMRDFTLAEKRKQHKYGQATEGFQMHVRV
jgi:hypothetical protein